MDQNLHLALLVAGGLLPAERLSELARANPPELDDDDDDPDYVYNQNLASALAGIAIPASARATITTIEWVDETLMFTIWPQFDGETDEFAISDLAGIEAFTALETLCVDTLEPLAHVAALASLTKLKTLSLGYGGAIANLAPFATLTELRSLHLHGPIANLAPLGNLAKLAKLGLEGLHATDVTPLLALPALESLTLAWDPGHPGPSRAAAQAFVDQLSPTIALDAAWPCGEVKPVRPPTVRARDAVLEARLRADPEDDDTYLVYADWLQGQGDPTGQLITLDHQIGKQTSDALVEARRALLVVHREHLLGAYRPDDTTEWHLGFIRKAGASRHGLAELLAAPAARFLRELDLHVLDGNASLALLARAKPAPPLRVLHVRQGVDPTDASKIWKRYPALREIELRGHIQLGTIDLPALRVARISNLSSHEAFVSLPDAHWPMLEELELAMVYDVTRIAPLLDGRATPRLKKLRIETTDPQGCREAIARGVLHAQLEMLEIVGGEG